LRTALCDHGPGKVGMLAGIIAVCTPPEIAFLDVGRAQVLAEPQAQWGQIGGQGGRVKARYYRLTRLPHGLHLHLHAFSRFPVDKGVGIQAKPSFIYHLFNRNIMNTETSLWLLSKSFKILSIFLKFMSD